jgi:tRNA pseudouridine(38-40) synthase
MSELARTIRLRLAYEGTRYSGWQSQPGQATVQGALAEAMTAFYTSLDQYTLADIALGAQREEITRILLSTLS